MSMPRSVAIVTGGAGALGLGIAQRLAQDGHFVCLLDKNEAGLAAARSELEKSGGSVASYLVDLTSEADVSNVARQIARECGCCEVVVNNAGMLPAAQSIEQMSLATWDKTFDVNLRSVFLMLQAFGPQMLASKSGKIVNIGSTAASLPNASAPYAVTKAALVALSRQIAMEWGPRGVRCNTVSPGFLRTPLSEHFYANPETYRQRVTAVASRRLGTVADVANAVAFLASEQSSYINGQELVIDGGFLLTSLMLVQPERERYIAGEGW
jgi:NAD(P)-dependent dehydrogenase (short-subunit alcohol dehydrogenase family)